jgi:RimJ/RimL family protein N-acetyltransferase
VTSPAFRGRSVAPAAWCAIADELAAAGEQTLLTKVAVDNEPVHRALVKVGFQPAAQVDLVRVGPHSRVRVEAQATPGGRVAATLRR